MSVSHAPHDDLKVGARLMCLCVSHAPHDDLKVGARLMCLCVGRAVGNIQ